MNLTVVNTFIPILVGLLVLLGTLLTIKSNQLRDVKAKLSDRKYNTYHEIMAILFDLIKQTKRLESVSQNTILKRIMDVKRDLILYGNDEIVRKFFEWEENQLKAGYRIWNWAELGALVRKDMGNRRSKIGPDEILRSLFDNKDDYLEFKNTYLVK